MKTLDEKSRQTILAFDYYLAIRGTRPATLIGEPLETGAPASKP